LGVFTFLPTGLLPILFRIFSKFREISQICEQGERKNLQVNTLQVFTWVFTWVNTQVNTELGGKTGKYPGKNPGKYLVNTR